MARHRASVESLDGVAIDLPGAAAVQRSAAPRPPAPRSQWRAVALPAEHGGWGLTAEAVLLGLLVRPTWAGAAIAAAALLGFMARTPLKMAVGDRRRHRRLERTVRAEQVSSAEMAVLAGALAAASVAGQRWWWAPLVAAIPFFALELSFDVRSWGRRLLPELSGAMGMGAVAAAIGLAGGLEARVAIGLWVVLVGRAVAAVPFARTQVRRLKGHRDHRRTADAAQLGAAALVLAGWLLGLVPWPGVAAIAVLIASNLVAMRRRVRSAKEVGVVQMVAGLVVVAVVAAGVLSGA